MPRLAGKVAFITRGGSGISRATATLFEREAANVAIADIYGRAAEETCSSRERGVDLGLDRSGNGPLEAHC
jgi:NAD(P)-dependent dehydrogenase (short-subunit alcohol dehydrogenase family)